jgi:hypothetical protein
MKLAMDKTSITTLMAAITAEKYHEREAEVLLEMIDQGATNGEALARAALVYRKTGLRPIFDTDDPDERQNPDDDEF